MRSQACQVADEDNGHVSHSSFSSNVDVDMVTFTTLLLSLN